MNTTPQSAPANGICIYGASRNNIDEAYKLAARETGRLVALAGRPLVSGGGRGGLMAAAIEGANAAGGTTIGVLPQFMVDKGWQHPELSQMIVAPDMHTRKRTMASLSSAAIALPGGIGTLEELLEIMTWRQLGLFKGRVVILNTAGFYDGLVEFLHSVAAKGFMRYDMTGLFAVASTPQQAVELASR